MVELPLDDAATRYSEIAAAVNDIRFGLDITELDGAVAEALMANAEGFQTFTSRTAEILQQQSEAVRAQHAEDEQLRDAPKPADVRELEQKAKELGTLAAYSVSPIYQAAAKEAARVAAEKRAEREIALQKHTAAAATNAPLMKMEPPALPGIGAPQVGSGNDGAQNGGGINSINPQQSNPGSGNTNPGGGDTPSTSPSNTSPSSTSPSDGSISDTDVGTATSSDLMGSGTQPQQQMMGQPQAGAQQQPTTPAGAQGAGTPAGGNMLSNNNANANARNRNRRDERDKRDGTLDLSSGGVVGAVPVGAAGIDRGISVSGVTTDKDTTGRAGMTNLSAGGGKPGGDNAAPRGNMMRGGMMGGMGGMGSGAQGQQVKREPSTIVSALKDRYLHGLDSLKDGVDGGLIGRDTADAPVLDGTDQFLDDGKTKPNNGSGA